MGQAGLEVPVGAAAESSPRPLPFDQQAHRDRLNPTRRKPPGHLLPKQGGEGVTDEAIQDATGFLGMHKLHVELTRIFEGLGDGFLGDFVEDHPFDRHLGIQQLGQMPADALPFAVFVSGQQQLIRAL